MMVSALVTLPAGNSLDWTIALPNGSTFRRGTAFGLGATAQLPPFTVTGTHPSCFTPSAGNDAVRVQGRASSRGLRFRSTGRRPMSRLRIPAKVRDSPLPASPEQILGLGITGVVLESRRRHDPRPFRYSSRTPRCWRRSVAASMAHSVPPICESCRSPAPTASSCNRRAVRRERCRLWLSRDADGYVDQRHAVRRGTRAPRSERAAHLCGHRRNADRAPGARRRDESARRRGSSSSSAIPTVPWLTYTHLTGAGQTLVASPLPVTGTYTVFLEPEPAAKGAATASMEVLLDPGQSLGSRWADARHDDRRRGRKCALSRSPERPARTSGSASAVSR